jgi:Tol biopolymer transport system component
MCQVGGLGTLVQLCVMDIETGVITQLTNNSLQHLTASFSPDGSTIIFHRNVSGPLQLFTMPASGGSETQLTHPPGLNAYADWGNLKVNFPSPSSQP